VALPGQWWARPANSLRILGSNVIITIWAIFTNVLRRNAAFFENRCYEAFFCLKLQFESKQQILQNFRQKYKVWVPQNNTYICRMLCCGKFGR
jgi:hypothetical protein